MDETVRSYCDKEVIGTFSANAVSASSDDRLKFNEQPIQNGLNVVKQLTPYVYDKSKTLDVEEDTHTEAGLIAQEVLQTDLSFCVTGGDKDDIFGNTIKHPYRVNYNDVVAYIIAAIKELDAKIEKTS